MKNHATYYEIYFCVYANPALFATRRLAPV